MSDETPTHKRCRKCGELKRLDSFTRHKKTKDGINGECKICTRQRCKTYNANHTAEKRAYDATYRQTNIKKKLEYDRIYRATHSEEIREYKKINAEIGRQYSRLYYAANVERV